MANFDIAYERTLKNEGIGEYSNDPADAGGETWSGLTKKAEPNWAGWKIIDAQKKKKNFPSNLKDVQSQLLELAKPFYKTQYWDPVWGDKLENQKVANDMYDTAVLQGVGMSIKLQNRQLGFGDKTKMDDQLLNRLNDIV